MLEKSETLAQRLGEFPPPSFPPAHLGLVWRRAVETDFWKIRELIQDTEADDQSVRPTSEVEIDQLGGYLVTGTVSRSSRNHLHDIPANVEEPRTYDCIVGIDRTGKLQAFGAVSLYRPEKEIARANLFAATTKKWRGRGIGRALLNWQNIRARQILLDYYGPDCLLPAQIRNVVDAQMTDRRMLYVAAGFCLLRKIKVLRRSLTTPLGPRPENVTQLVGQQVGDERGELGKLCSARSLNLEEWQAVKQLHEENSLSLGASVEDANRWWDRVQSTLVADLSFVVIGHGGRCEAYCLTQKRALYEGTENAEIGASIELFGRQDDTDPLVLAATIVEVVKAARDQGYDTVSAEDNRDCDDELSQLLQTVGFSEVGARMIYTVDL